jgi:hypothetical protein
MPNRQLKRRIKSQTDNHPGKRQIASKDPHPGTLQLEKSEISKSAVARRFPSENRPGII